MSLQSGVTLGTPQKIPFGAGVYFKGITYDEKIAPTVEAIKAAIFGATQEGGTLNIVPELWKPELDGVTVEMKELQRKIGEHAHMEVSFAEFTPELAKNMVIGKMEDSTDGKYDVITSSDLKDEHFYEGFGYYGEYLDGRPMIIIFKTALCTTGLVPDHKNKTNTVYKGTFACQSDIAYSTTKLPYAIFIYKEDQWVAADPEELAA